MTYGHYVPQLHIRHFGINEKQTARFDKKTDRKIVVSIESFCGEDDYFSFDESSLTDLPWYLRWIDKDLIERRLAQFIEGPVSSILKILITEKTLKALSEQEILMLLEWLAWLFIANPQSMAISSIESITNRFKNIDYKNLSQTERLKTFIDLHAQITPVFQQRGWLLQVIEPHHGRLISSDRPVLIGGKSLQELPQLSSHTILFPLSPELVLIGDNNPIWGYASKPLESRKEASLITNILTLHQSYRFVFGADMNDLDNLFKILKDTPQP
jgi:Protein of unknown function (DUF4238)